MPPKRKSVSKVSADSILEPEPLKSESLISSSKSKTQTKSKKTVEHLSVSIPKVVTILKETGETYDPELMATHSMNQGQITQVNIDIKIDETSAPVIQTLVEPTGRNLVIFFYKSNYDTMGIYKEWNKDPNVISLKKYLYQNLFNTSPEILKPIISAGYNKDDKNINMVIIDRRLIQFANDSPSFTGFLSETFRRYDLFGRLNGNRQIRLKQSANQKLFDEARDALVIVNPLKGGSKRKTSKKRK